MNTSPRTGNKLVWHYQSFMLRLWREAPDEPYRASLQATTNGEQVAFADLATLFTFLSEMESPPSISRLDLANTEQNK